LSFDIKAMVDALKFAFEILIVGALALPWVAILAIMFPGEPSSKPAFYLSIIPEPAQNAVVLAVVIALGYLLGSAVSRVSRNFFDDDDFWRGAPTEQSIRTAVYGDEYCNNHLLRQLSLPHLPSSQPKSGSGLPQWFCQSWDKNKDFNRYVEELFRLQESRLLLSGQDKTDRMRQYFDQIIVLRGAAFNFFLVFALCVFGMAGNWRARLASKPTLRASTLLAPAIVLGYGGFSLVHHFRQLVRQQDIYRHPPFAELVLLALGIVGVIAVTRARHTTMYCRTLLIAAFLCVISFGGWWWTEVMYDTQVIYMRPTGYIDAEERASNGSASVGDP
jgi:hypothetical protein